MFLSDFVYRKKEMLFHNRLLLSIEKISYLAGTFISFYFALTYESSAWKRALNNFLADRLRYSRNSLLKYGVHLFGQQISWSGMGLSQNGVRTLENIWVGYDWVDNAYIQLFQLYGIVVAGTFIVMVTIAICHMIKKRQYYLSFIAMLYAIYGLIDTACLSLIYNMTWLAIFGASIRIYNENDYKPSTVIHKLLARKSEVTNTKCCIKTN